MVETLWAITMIVTLFPLNQNAEDLLMEAPSEATEKQLKELSIKTVKKD